MAKQTIETEKTTTTVKFSPSKAVENIKNFFKGLFGGGG